MLKRKFRAFSFDILCNVTKINNLLNTTKSLLEKASHCSLSTAEGCSVINNLSAVGCSSYHSLLPRAHPHHTPEVTFCLRCVVFQPDQLPGLVNCVLTQALVAAPLRGRRSRVPG